MRSKRILTFAVISLLCAVMPHNVSLAAKEPLVTREYISRKIGGETGNEEKLCVSYQDLHTVNGYYAKITFFGQSNIKLKECEIAMNCGDALPNELAFNTQSLQGCRYVQIDIIAPGYNFTGIRVPFEI